MSHLTLDNRKMISNMISHKAKCKDTTIAVGCNSTTISKELKKNCIISKKAKENRKTLCKKPYRFPFVCLDCPKKYSSCILTQMRCNPEFAQVKYEKVLYECRRGINLTKEEHF